MRTTSALAPTGPARPPALAAAAERIRDYAEAAHAANTRRAHAADWRAWVAWCGEHGAPALPAAAETVALYLADQAGVLKASTLRRRLTTVGRAHKAAGHENPAAHPAVRTVWAGIRRRHGTAQDGKAPATVDELRRMLAVLPETRRGARDRALLLLGFAGAFRRSELVGQECADVAPAPGGLVVTLRRSKTDQEGEGRRVGIPFGSGERSCPVRALERWRELGAIADGPLFRPVDNAGRVLAGRLSDRAVARAVKRAAAAAGLDADRYAGHSLRAGHATSAAAAGVEERVIARQTGHRSIAVLRRYIREGALFAPGQNSAAAIGL